MNRATAIGERLIGERVGFFLHNRPCGPSGYYLGTIIGVKWDPKRKDQPYRIRSFRVRMFNPGQSLRTVDRRELTMARHPVGIYLKAGGCRQIWELETEANNGQDGHKAKDKTI